MKPLDGRAGSNQGAENPYEEDGDFELSPETVELKDTPVPERENSLSPEEETKLMYMAEFNKVDGLDITEAIGELEVNVDEEDANVQYKLSDYAMDFGSVNITELLESEQVKNPDIRYESNVDEAHGNLIFEFDHAYDSLEDIRWIANWAASVESELKY